MFSLVNFLSGLQCVHCSTTIYFVYFHWRRGKFEETPQTPNIWLITFGHSFGCQMYFQREITWFDKAVKWINRRKLDQLGKRKKEERNRNDQAYQVKWIYSYCCFKSTLAISNKHTLYPVRWRWTYTLSQNHNLCTCVCVCYGNFFCSLINESIC